MCGLSQPLAPAAAAQEAPTALEKFFNATYSGLALGAIYALLALGLVLIYKATQILNFAHGALAAMGKAIELEPKRAYFKRRKLQLAAANGQPSALTKTADAANAAETGAATPTPTAR